MRRGFEQTLQMLEALTNYNYLKKNEALLKANDPALFSELSPHLSEIQGQLQQFPHLVDLGSGRNPVRWLGLANFQVITAIDPAYQWYEHEPESEEQIFHPPYPAGVYGGKEEKKELVTQLRKALRGLKLPTAIQGDQQQSIEGQRHDHFVKIELVPQSAVEWLERQPSGSISAIAVWRVFPSLNHWQLVLSKLKTGGLLITTGEGQSRWDQQGVFAANVGLFSGGADLNNSALPLNRNWDELGIHPVFPDWQVPYFYRKR